MRAGGLRSTVYALAGLRSTAYALAVLLCVYGVMAYLTRDGKRSAGLRAYEMIDRTAWHNASARPPVILVLVVVGWSVVVNRCRSAGIKLELVLGPGPLLPARASLRCGLALLNAVLIAHLVHFVAEERTGSSRPWYLACELALHLAIVVVFLAPPPAARALSSRPSDAGFLLAASGVVSPSKKGLDEDVVASSSRDAAPDAESETAYFLRGPYPDGKGHDEARKPSSKKRDPSQALWCYPGARAGLCKALRETLAAPFAPVTFWHVIVADYATSLAKALGDVQITACVASSALFTGDGFWSAPNQGIYGGDIPSRWSSSDAIFDRYRRSCAASPVNACALALPFWCRLAQCLRCYAETRERKHLINGLKYCSAFPLVIAGFVRKNADPADVVTRRRAQNFLVAAAVLNSSFSFAWDVVMDWGLLRPKRRSIVLARRSRFAAFCAYAALLVFNLLMRFAWAVAVFSHAPTVGAGMFALEAVEVLRRTVWAVFRIELEYIAKDLPVYPGQPDPRGGLSSQAGGGCSTKNTDHSEGTARPGIAVAVPVGGGADVDESAGLGGASPDK